MASRGRHATGLARVMTKRRDRWFYQTANAKAAIRVSKIGKALSRAHKLAISNGKLSYMPDKDHCEAISKGMKRWWARRKTQNVER